LGLLNLRHAHLVGLVARLGRRFGVPLLLSQGPLVGLILGLHSGGERCIMRATTSTGGFARPIWPAL
jgi:hypothetical protein